MWSHFCLSKVEYYFAPLRGSNPALWEAKETTMTNLASEINTPRLYRAPWAWICVLLVLSTSGFSQVLVSDNRPINREIAIKAAGLLEQSLDDYDSQGPRDAEASMTGLTGFFEKSLFQTELLKDEWFNTKINQVKRNKGIDFTSSLQHNEYGSFYDGDENNSRARVGLEADMLDEGYLKWIRERKKLQLDQQIHQMESAATSRDRNYAYLYNCLIYSFNLEKQKLLKNRVAFLESFIEIYYQLYFAHEMAFERIIDLKSRLEEAKILLDGSLAFNEALESELGKENIALVDARNIPVVQIRIEELLDPDALSIYQDSLSSLKAGAIDLKYKNSSDSKLKLFARYNWGDYFSNTSRKSFISLGATFRTPIRFDKGLRSELAAYEKAMVEERFSEQWYNRIKEIMILYEEYQYKLKQYSNFLHKIFHNDEKIRQERVLLDNRRGAHSPMKALGKLENIQAINYELLHLKQQLYLLLLQINLRNYESDFTQYLQPLDLNASSKKLIGNRFIILKTSRGMEKDIEFILKYLEKNEIQGILLDAQDQADKWVTSLSYSGIDIYVNSNFNTKNTRNEKTTTAGTFQLESGSGRYLIKQQVSTGKLQQPQQLMRVPDEIFENRNELERWIEIENKNNGTSAFLFEGVEQLMKLDQRNLGME